VKSNSGVLSSDLEEKLNELRLVFSYDTKTLTKFLKENAYDVDSATAAILEWQDEQES
jgi:hypothetical protein